MKSTIKVIDWNLHGEEICASSARISTTEGSALTLFEKAQGNPNNQKLVARVSSIHHSIKEHLVFSLALENVSVFVEQFFIEHRLASFTIKSRRYVDYTNQGYYVPDEIEKNTDAAKFYRTYMDDLFADYHVLLEAGIPKEDARFLLPYSLCSNFYCTINAGELSQLLREMIVGRSSNIPELQNLAHQLIMQLKDFPWLIGDFGVQTSTPQEVSAFRIGEVAQFVSAKDAANVQIIGGPSNPQSTLAIACYVANPTVGIGDPVKTVFNSERPRPLEQLSYTFYFPDVTLSTITHLTRHRMQSIIIPPIQTLDHSKFILPDTISDNEAACLRYKAAVLRSWEKIKEVADNPLLRKYGYYFALSGNVMPIMTTMNARELKHFIRLRSCNRAQWEIRNLSNRILSLLRAHFPNLFDLYGPSCYLTGKCPEGRGSCGQCAEMQRRFAPGSDLS